MLAPMALNPISTPSRGRTQIHVRETTNTGVSPASERLEGFYLPRAQLEGGVGIRASRYFAMRIRVGTFLPEDAQRVTSSASGAPGRPGISFGLAPTLTVPLDSARTLLTLAPDLTFATLPITARDCGPSDDVDGGDYFFTCGGEHESTLAGFAAGGAVAAFRWIDDRMRLGATIGVRTQPTFKRAFSSEPPGVGHIAVVLGVEMFLQISDRLFFSLESQWLGVVAPYFVYPTVGLMFGGSVADGPGRDPIDVSSWLR